MPEPKAINPPKSMNKTVPPKNTEAMICI
jgi:hypothetical protein